MLASGAGFRWLGLDRFRMRFNQGLLANVWAAVRFANAHLSDDEAVAKMGHPVSFSIVKLLRSGNLLRRSGRAV
jgi:hypothetical protein